MLALVAQVAATGRIRKLTSTAANSSQDKGRRASYAAVRSGAARGGDAAAALSPDSIDKARSKPGSGWQQPYPIRANSDHGLRRQGAPAAGTSSKSTKLPETASTTMSKSRTTISAWRNATARSLSAMSLSVPRPMRIRLPEVLTSRSLVECSRWAGW